MRRGRNPELITLDDQFIGVNLSADYCAEHEFGLKGLKFELGFGGLAQTKFGMGDKDDISKRKTGVAARTIVKGGEHIIYEEIGDKTYLVYDDGAYGANRIKNIGKEYFSQHTELRFYDNDKTDVAAAWSGDDFGIAVKGKELRAKLQELRDAFKLHDIAIMHGGGGVFENPGLVVAIASRIPKSANKELIEMDLAKLKKTAP